ncbi:MAG: sensor histidine kinase, partial [Pedobacter sp.]|nr:sensor histidine kinase [Pedobacter sp.]
MKLSVLVLITALAVGLSIGLVNFHFQGSWYYLLISFGVSFVTSFLVFYYLLEKYIYTKIKLIYKLIHNLKLGKDLKEAIGEYKSSDPINDVEQ